MDMGERVEAQAPKPLPHKSFLLEDLDLDYMRNDYRAIVDSAICLYNAIADDRIAVNIDTVAYVGVEEKPVNEKIYVDIELVSGTLLRLVFHIDGDGRIHRAEKEVLY